VNENIRLLEDRVQLAAARLRELSSERRRLSAELLALRERLERLESGEPDNGSKNDDVRHWPAQKLDVLATLRETIEQLQD